MNILTDEEIAELKNQHFVMDRYGEVFEFNKFARAIESAVLSKLAEQAGEPVAYMYEYSYDLNGDKQGNWPVEMHTHVSFSRTKPNCVSSPLYTEAQLIAAQQRTAEACAKLLKDNLGHLPRGDALVAIRNGEWRGYL